jgi:hypothetical protein
LAPSRRSPPNFLGQLLELPNATQSSLTRYQKAPVRYMREVLGVDPWAKQREIARLLLTPPYKVLGKACHGVGKTHASACLTSWWFDTHPEDSAVITTAPTARDVRDLLWTEVRGQRRRAIVPGLADHFIGEKAPEMATSESHYAKGFTASTGESFVGRHLRYMLFIFDEAIGVDPIFWETVKSMFQPNGEHAWLCIFNPTDTSSQAYAEELMTGLDGKPAWHVVSMAAMEHPNITEALEGRDAPYPGAVSLAQVDTWVAEWCEPIGVGEVDAALGDFEWRPGSGSWHRPGPLFDSRACGRWPRQGSYGVWSDLAWTLATSPAEQVVAAGELPVIGADLASTGGDFSEFHTRHGTHSLAHERHNGWAEDQIAGRLKVLCAEMAALFNAKLQLGKAQVRPQDIPVHYDADGRGGALASHRGDYKFVPIHASSAARAAGKFPNRRSELWFGTVMLARSGQVNLSRLDRDSQNRLRQEAMSPRWKLDAAGRQVVEKKDETKRRLKKSPDGMDAVNLAYVRPGDFVAVSSASAPDVAPKGRRMGDEQMARGERGRNLFGRS